MPVLRMRRPGGTSPLAFAGVLLATLLGLVGMHGIGGHGVHWPDTTHAPADPMAHHSVAPAGAAAADSLDAVEGPSGSALSLLEICCVAMLIGLGFVLWAQRRLDGAASADRPRRTSSVLNPRLHGRGPPSLAELSILRC